MSYRVFARKYRPQTFEEVVGQDHITRTLRNAISSKRLAQAYLFVGPRGIGKTSTARILAKALNCEKGPTIMPCGVCDACVEIAEGRSLDVIEIDGASNNGVENIRELRENVAYAPARGPYKIYLIDEVHMLSSGAFNALLKTLEEPPPHVKFIFATTEAQKVPATITSRCQRFDLRRIPADLIASHLLGIATKEKITLDPAAADAIARGADGGLRDAESMLDQVVAFCGGKISAEDVLDVFGFTSRETVIELAQRIFDNDAPGALGLVAAQSEAGKDLTRLLAELISHLRDLLVLSASGAEGVPIPQSKLLELLDHFAAVETRMKWAVDRKLQFDVAVIKALHLLDQTSLTDIIDSLSSMASGTPPSAMPRSRPPVVEAKSPALATNAATPKVSEETKAVLESKAVASTESSALWDKTAADFAQKSFIRFGWLKEGVFVSLEEGRLRLRFPGDCQPHTENIFWQQGKSELERTLSNATGGPVKLALEFEEIVAQSPVLIEEAPEEMEAARPAKPAAPVETVEENFKNDPLIKKALEIFRGETQTANQ